MRNRKNCLAVLLMTTIVVMGCGNQQPDGADCVFDHVFKTALRIGCVLCACYECGNLYAAVPAGKGGECTADTGEKSEIQNVKTETDGPRTRRCAGLTVQDGREWVMSGMVVQEKWNASVY